MWLLVGDLRRVIQRPGSTDKASHQVQILSEETLSNGEVREAILSFNTNQPKRFESLVGKRVAVEVSPFPRKDGTLGFTCPESGFCGPFEALS